MIPLHALEIKLPMNCANPIAHPRKRIDKPARLLHHLYVASKTATGIGLPITKADGRLLRHFLRPFHTIGTSSSMAGLGGSVHARAGSFVPVDQSRPVPAAPDWSRDGKRNAYEGGLHA